jgi:CheY-like chemotaxis protein
MNGEDPDWNQSPFRFGTSTCFGKVRFGGVDGKARKRWRLYGEGVGNHLAMSMAEGYMIEPNPPTRHIQELFEKLQGAILGKFVSGAITIASPEYLPLVLLTEAAEQGIVLAAQVIAKCAREGDSLMVSGHYEDRHERSSCCVVLALQLRRPGMEGYFAVDNSWLEELGTISQQLLIEFIDLTLSVENGSLNCDIRIPAHHSQEKPTSHRNTILLVEDDGFVRNATREVLEMSGYIVLEAEDAEAALLAFERKRQTLCAVLSDVTMPGRSGRELAALLHASAPELPVLLMSGYASPVIEEPSKHIYYLAKPYNSDALLKALRRCLEAHHGAAFVGVRENHLLGSAQQAMPFLGACETGLFVE